MRESVLREFFSGLISPQALAEDVKGSTKQITNIESVVEIEDMQGPFRISRGMLVSLCDAVLSGELPPTDLAAIGFALMASEAFEWDDDLMSEVIEDWSCPEINYALTPDNVEKFRNWLLGVEPYPARPVRKQESGPERLVSVRRKSKLGGSVLPG
jgi:hypothetical protein